MNRSAPPHGQADVRFEPPTREALLACEHPAALFGAAAHDPRALRAAWAALARAFPGGEDPEAFLQARQLFERARDALQRLGEAAPRIHLPTDTPQPALPTQARGADPLHRFVDPTAPGADRVSAAVALGLRAPTLSPEMRAHVWRLLDRFDFPIDAGSRRQLATRLAVADELARATSEGRVPEGLATAIATAGAGDVRGALGAALVWAMATPEVELRQTVAELDLTHPTLTGALVAMHLTAVRQASPPSRAQIDALNSICHAVPPWWVPEPRGARLAAIGAVTVLAALALLLVKTPFAVVTGVLLGAAGLTIAAMPLARGATPRRGRDALLHACSALGLFPIELERWLDPEARRRLGEGRPIGADHPFITIPSAPADLLVVLRPTHLLRLGPPP